MRLIIIFGLAVLGLAAPQAAGAQTYCASGATSNSGFTSYVPTGYSHYYGFASFPGAIASGLLPAGYSTNPYTGCAPTTPQTSANPVDLSGSTTSAPTYSAVVASNVYNPYSGWGLTNAASYPFASYGNGASSAATNPLYGGTTPYSGFAGFPGMAPSGYLTAGTTSAVVQSSASSNAAPSPTAAGSPATTSSYGGYTPTASPFSTPSSASYYNAAGVPIYYGGANASSSGAGTSAGAAAGSGGSGASPSFGTGYYTYGNSAPTAAPYSGVSTMITFGCGGTC